MPWAPSRPGGSKVNPKYTSKEHREIRAAMKAQLERDGSAQCAQPICVMRSRLILPGMKWHAGHDDSGTRYIGLVHQLCNVRDGARRARARQEATRLSWGGQRPQCGTCGAPIAETRKYCSQRCGYIANPHRAPKPKVAKVERPKPQPTAHTCCLCGATFTDAKRKYCSSECMWEANARKSRERYRAKVGLPPTPDRPRRSTLLTW